MKRYERILILVLIVAAAAAFMINNEKKEVSVKPKPATVETVAGTDLRRVVLTQKASERLGIQTAVVRDEAVNGAPRKIIPYSAVLYDANGNTWTYANPEGLVFVRARIVVERINGDQAVLTEGPVAGTKVASVGASELLGTEFGVGH